MLAPGPDPRAPSTPSAHGAASPTCQRAGRCARTLFQGSFHQPGLLCVVPPSLLPPSPLPSLPQVPPSVVTEWCINPLLWHIPQHGGTGDPGTLAPGTSCCHWPLGSWDFALLGPAAQSPLARFPGAPGRCLVGNSSAPAAAPARMSDKRAEEAPAEVGAKDLKEKKEKLEEKTVCKEKKKEITEDEENGAEEEEENPEDVDEEEAGEEDEDGDENGQEQDGHAAKRSAEEEEEDEADPKRQKTENGSSA